MIGSIIQGSLHTNNRISGKRTGFNGFCNAFLHCREEVLRNRASDNTLIKFIWMIQITGRFKCHLYMTILSVSARLFLILIFNIGFLTDRLSERNLWTHQFYCDLVLLK